jgi:hypothetical protein
LPLPSGLIGQAEPVRSDAAAARPFFPFLSAAQMLLCLALYIVVAGAIVLFLPRAWLFILIGSAIGIVPSIIQAAPAHVAVRTPRPEPWAEFTRQWAALSRYRQQDDNPDVWLPDMPIWLKWPGDSIRLTVTENGLEVRGRRLLMQQLKRNFDRITKHGHPV